MRCSTGTPCTIERVRPETKELKLNYDKELKRVINKLDELISSKTSTELDIFRACSKIRDISKSKSSIRFICKNRHNAENFLNEIDKFTTLFSSSTKQYIIDNAERYIEILQNNALLFKNGYSNNTVIHFQQLVFNDTELESIDQRDKQLAKNREKATDERDRQKKESKELKRNNIIMFYASKQVDDLYSNVPKTAENRDRRIKLINNRVAAIKKLLSIFKERYPDSSYVANNGLQASLIKQFEIEFCHKRDLITIDDINKLCKSISNIAAMDVCMHSKFYDKIDIDKIAIEIYRCSSLEPGVLYNNGNKIIYEVNTSGWNEYTSVMYYMYKVMELFNSNIAKICGEEYPIIETSSLSTRELIKRLSSLEHGVYSSIKKLQELYINCDEQYRLRWLVWVPFIYCGEKSKLPGNYCGALTGFIHKGETAWKSRGPKAALKYEDDLKFRYSVCRGGLKPYEELKDRVVGNSKSTRIEAYRNKITATWPEVSSRVRSISELKLLRLNYIATKTPHLSSAEAFDIASNKEHYNEYANRYIK